LRGPLGCADGRDLRRGPTGVAILPIGYPGQARAFPARGRPSTGRSGPGRRTGSRRGSGDPARRSAMHTDRRSGGLRRSAWRCARPRQLFQCRYAPAARPTPDPLAPWRAPARLDLTPHRCPLGTCRQGLAPLRCPSVARGMPWHQSVGNLIDERRAGRRSHRHPRCWRF
jgi:hypothetical protein